MSTTTALAVPAAVASLAYLNAKWSFPNDWRIISNLVRARINWAKREKRGHINAWYPLEHNAFNPRIANGIFMIYQNKSWTFKETYDMSLRYAGWLHHTLGIKPKEIVAVDFMNSPEFVFITLGLWSLGAVPAYINYNLTGPALVHCVKTSTARLLLVDPNIEHNLTEEVRSTFASPTFRNEAFPLEVVTVDTGFATSLSYFPPYRAPDSARSDLTGRSPSCLIFTSGTTGLPKAAIMPWSRFGLGIFVADWQGLRPCHRKNPDRYYTCMPLYHSSALLCCFAPCLASGTTMVLGHKFSARNFWSEVRQSNATVIQYVGETLRYLLANPPSPLDTDNKVRLAFGNGLRPDVWDKFKERFDVETIAEFYSATEGTSGSWNYSSNSFASGAIGRNGWIGELILRKELAVVKVDWETEQPWRNPKTGLCEKVPRGEIGELLYALDAKNIEAKFSGYFKNQKANDSKIMRDAIKKGDAWFRTGDVVRWDSEGRCE
jgi:acyl-CoA synthetase (AMP-forming)/AMP-acid ligase II